MNELGYVTSVIILKTAQPENYLAGCRSEARTSQSWRSYQLLSCARHKVSIGLFLCYSIDGRQIVEH